MLCTEGMKMKVRRFVGAGESLNDEEISQSQRHCWIGMKRYDAEYLKVESRRLIYS